MRNANKIRKIHYFGMWKNNCILYQGTDHTKSLSILPICRSNHNTNFQWNLLITLSVMLHTDRMTDKPTSSQNLSQLNVIHGFKMSTCILYTGAKSITVP